MAGRPKPLILLAFANEQRVRRIEDAAEAAGEYLDQLLREQRGVEKALEDAVRHGRCEVKVRANATREQVLNDFQRNRGRVAIFHFGGHAGGEAIFLESEEGVTEAAYAEGLADLMHGQEGLRLVFLNGCNSRDQVVRLQEAGVPVVVATSHEIDDRIAARFAVQFYKRLDAGSSIALAYDDAVDAVKLGTKEAAEAYTRSFKPSRSAEIEWPWRLYGADEALEWTIPEAPRWTPRRLLLVAIGVVAALLLLIFLYRAWTAPRFEVSTPESGVSAQPAPPLPIGRAAP